MVRDVKKTYVTFCPTYILWYEIFILGIHKRMGDEVRQDIVVSLDVVHKLVEDLEEEYKLAGDVDEMVKLTDLAVFVLAPFLAGLRGEEVTKLILEEVRRVIGESRYHHKRPHIVLLLRGRFIGETGETYHMIAVSVDTNSGLRIGEWIKIRVELKERSGLVKGDYFTDRKGQTIEVVDMESDILDMIKTFKHAIKI